MKKLFTLITLILTLCACTTNNYLNNGEYQSVTNDVTVIIKNDTFEFVGSGDSYESMVDKFGKKGSIVKEIEESGYKYYSITDNGSGPHIVIINDNEIQFSEGVNYSAGYNFKK